MSKANKHVASAVIALVMALLAGQAIACDANQNPISVNEKRSIASRSQPVAPAPIVINADGTIQRR